MSDQIKAGTIEQKAQGIKLVLGDNKGVAKIVAKVTKMMVLSDFSVDVCEHNEMPATAVDTEIVGLLNLYIKYKAGYSLILKGVYTNYVTQGTIPTLRELNDEIGGSSFFFDLEHGSLSGEKNPICYMIEDEEAELSILVGANEALNNEYEEFNLYDYLESSLNQQGEGRELLTDEQAAEVSESIRSQMLSLLSNKLV